MDNIDNLAPRIFIHSMNEMNFSVIIAEAVALIAGTTVNQSLYHNFNLMLSVSVSIVVKHYMETKCAWM